MDPVSSDPSANACTLPPAEPNFTPVEPPKPKKQPTDPPTSNAPTSDAATKYAMAMKKTSPPVDDEVDVSKWSSALLEKNYDALRLRAIEDPKSLTAGESKLLEKMEQEMTKRQENVPGLKLAPVDPQKKFVELCKSAMDVDECGLKYSGLQHWWIHTSKKEAGMGPATGGVPGEKGVDNGHIFGKTTINDHSPRHLYADATCTVLPDVDEDCMNEQLEIGKETGRWIPVINDCHSKTEEWIDACRRGPETFGDDL